MSTDFTIDEILESLKTFPASYPYDLIAAAVERREEITPRLIEVLKEVLTDPEAAAGDENYALPLFAVYLLGHFRETTAHEVLAELLEMPHDPADRLFGDVIHEGFPIILLRTSGGSLDRIKSLVLDKRVNEYHRNAAAKALTYAVVESLVSREEVLSFLGDLFTGDEAHEGSDFWSFMGSCMCDLYPEEQMDLIQAAYDDDLIFPGYIAPADFEREMSVGKEACLENLERDMRYRDVDDLYKSMSWWAAPETKKENLSRIPDPWPNALPPAPKEVKAKKKKRKSTKASKKKNRRK